MKNLPTLCIIITVLLSLCLTGYTPSSSSWFLQPISWHPPPNTSGHTKLLISPPQWTTGAQEISSIRWSTLCRQRRFP